MKILCLDTAMAACSAAVLDTQRGCVLAEAFQPMERGHAEALAPMVAAVMHEAGIGYDALERVAVTIGPGTFTGVRIGLSFARGLGLALGIPVFGIDSLSAIAANETDAVPLVVAADARNDEVYVAVFDAARKPLNPPRVASAAEVSWQVPQGARVIGTAARHVIEASGRADLVPSTAGDLPVASRFGALAAGSMPGPSPAPLYLRAPDARSQEAPLRKIMGLAIEPATAAASSLLATLHAETFADGWSAASFVSLLENPGTAAAVALAGGEPVGFVVTRGAADEAEIITIGTRPSVQRRGVARQLLERHMARLAASGVRRLFLEVAASNVSAQALYSTLGFKEAGRRKGYYQREGYTEDAIVMQRELLP